MSLKRFGQSRHKLGDAFTRDAGFRGGGLTAILMTWLGIERIDVRHPASHIHVDDVLGFSASGLSHGLLGGRQHAEAKRGFRGPFHKVAAGERIETI